MANCGRRYAARDAPARRCNLDRFLEATTPVVRSSYSAKKSVDGWRKSDELPFFILGDLWDAFEECSAYGTSVPLALKGCSDGVVQYYVPYLSAIQLYGVLRRHYHSRTSAEESDSDCCQDTGSDGASDHEHESSASTDVFSGQDTYGSSTSDASSDEGESRNCHEQLIFEFLESEPPYQRAPLVDKISSLAKSFPELKTLRSRDLSPASWMSVAWYPIYRIPTGPTMRELDACFLTYHSLSTQFTGNLGGGPEPTKLASTHGAPVTAMSLPTFAMASSKFRAAAWALGGRDRHLAASLSQAADSWLGLLRVDHPDHRFFASRRVVSRR